MTCDDAYKVKQYEMEDDYYYKGQVNDQNLAHGLGIKSRERNATNFEFHEKLYTNGNEGRNIRYIDIHIVNDAYNIFIHTSYGSKFIQIRNPGNGINDDDSDILS